MRLYGEHTKPKLMRRIFISWLIALCATNVALCANVTQTTAPISLVGGGAGDIIVPTTSPDFVPISDINQKDLLLPDALHMEDL